MIYFCADNQYLHTIIYPFSMRLA